MRRWIIWGAVVTGSFALHCAGGDEERTPEEKRQNVRDHGTYCCTHDGAPSPGTTCTTRPGAVYLLDFQDVDASGRGDSCGWILNP